MLFGEAGGRTWPVKPMTPRKARGLPGPGGEQTDLPPWKDTGAWCSQMVKAAVESNAAAREQVEAALAEIAETVEWLRQGAGV